VRIFGAMRNDRIHALEAGCGRRSVAKRARRRR
jgi:hypothetical protein